MFKSILENVQKTSPLIHNITNYVTVNDVANVILACGASPIMADDSEEVEDITSICSALNINIGTLNKNTIKSMLLAGKKANELNHPVVLDPVGVGASSLRNNTAKELLENIKFDVIRGNISEIKFLATGIGSGKGVDAGIDDVVSEENLDSIVEFVKSFSKKTESVIAITGAIDLISDSEKCFVIRNGRAEMGKITGTGCQLSGLITSFVAANQDNILEATAAAVATMGLSGEIGWANMKQTDGNSTYRNRIIDAIYNMSGEKLEEGAKFEIK
ncbi:hydroxyethylthiazole kinase [Peptacetobacter sp.]|uniref:hydroxyethylthiazole kinase n=1 Tax=Peptacetobacter sp. TaxID=2991975 RepID=UPI0026228C2A|nr:hydroxyethylthiazole kinase [Peptacetobacter sp.]